MSNKKTEEKQCTIFWYVYDNKALHVNPKAIVKILSDLKVYFRDILITRGNKHSFLGMEIEITKENKIDIDMK